MPSPLRLLNFRVLIVLLALTLHGAVFAQPQRLPGALQVLPPSSTPPAVSHAWIVLPVWGDQPWGLVHVPPRRLASAGEALSRGVKDGAIRTALRLSTPPRFLAAVGPRVYAFFAPESSAPQVWNVASVAAVPIGLGDLWTESPPARLQPELPLTAQQVLAAVGTPDGPVALVRNGDQRALLRLTSAGWQSLPAPAALSSSAPAGLTALPTGLGLWTVTDRALTVSTLAFPDEKSAAPAWQSLTLTAPPDAAAAAARDDFTLVFAGARWGAVVASPPDRLSLWILDRTSAVAAWADNLDAHSFGASSAAPASAAASSIPGKPAATSLSYAVAGVDGLGRLILVATESAPPPASDFPLAVPGSRDTPDATATPRVVELSLWTGAVLYDGPAQAVGPITRTEFQLLVVALLALMSLVLAFVLRAERGDDIVHLPAGLALAEPGRRLMASLLDLTFVSVVVTRLWGTTVTGLFAPEALLTGFTWPIAASIIVVGLLYAGVMEWLTGRTLGKFLVGCAVIRVSHLVPPELGPSTSTVTPRYLVLPRLTLLRSLARNTVKWLLPPVAGLALLDPSSRHRGDLLTGAAVVVAAPPSDDAPAEPS